jgi:putative toxin-antitoxin system antitoxin component (TIGR02293 family)
MKKDKSEPKTYTSETTIYKVEEPYISIPRVSKIQAALADYSYKKFQKVAEKAPFTLAEWANILHLSERTLQRYAKDNKNFEGIYVDRILQIEKLVDLGLEVFIDANAFYTWLKKPKAVLGERITFESLYHSDGIYQILEQLGRIKHGVYV